MIMTPTLIAASNRRYKPQEINPLSIIYPTEGGEVSNGETLEVEHEITAMRIIFPTEGSEVQNGDTLEIEVE